MQAVEIIENAAAISHTELAPLHIAGGVAILRRSVLACAAEHTEQDQLDCAELALTLGYLDAARLLYQGVFIRGGFSPKQVASQARVAARTALWPEDACLTGSSLPPSLPRPVNFAIEAAIAELRKIIELVPNVPLTELPAVDVAAIIAETPPLAPEVSRAFDAKPFDANVVMDLSRRLCTSLRLGDDTELGKVLERVQDELLNQPLWKLSDHTDASVTELAAGIVFNQLRTLFNLHHDLCWPPFGSVALFSAAARLGEASLGPYFTNVKHLLRSNRDLFGLALIAGADDGSGFSLRFQRLLVLLSTHLSEDSKIALAEELGDRGLLNALRGLLATTCRTTTGTTHLIWVIRDAALDLGAVDLAAHAQARIVRSFPTKAEEWVVLAEVLGSGGASATAEQALNEALRLAPLHEAALERKVALELDQFEAFHVLSGFGTPPWRLALRRRSP